VSHKSARIAAMIESFQGQELDAHYLGYFDCFNRQLFYEAHDVLEDLWLPDRRGQNGDFYKGLIQLAGAFVHLQKNRLRPAAALFKLAQANLEKYPRIHERLDLAVVFELIASWLALLESKNFEVNPLSATNVPQLSWLRTDNFGWVFYDGDCAFCINSIQRFQGILKHSRFVPTPFQTPWAHTRLNLPSDSVPEEMLVLTTDNRRFGGADGIVQIARRVWWAWLLFAFAQIPGVLPLLRNLYRRVAAKRHCLSGACTIVPREIHE
jgi:predicted metal-dependent hydrolase/predicted DCC family thiol-disulfide oxidoreductase YuxK